MPEPHNNDNSGEGIIMRLRKMALSAAGSLALFGTVPAAQAVDLTAGDWTLSFNGNVNANYVYTACDNTAPVSFGGALAGGVVGACNINAPIEDDVSQIRTGLLPAALVFTAATQQNGWDVSGTFGLYPGIVTNEDGGVGPGGSPNLSPGNNVALGTTSLDIRQVFLKFGSADFGEVKAGRDFGLFGFDAIINDMTIPAVGLSTLAVGSPGNTTLGSIGFGYIYVDTLAQINYTTPDFNGFTGTIGVFQTIDSLSAPSTIGVGETLPGFHGQLRYAWDGGFVSTNVVTLEVDGNEVDTDGDGVVDGQLLNEERVYGVDLTFNNTFGPVGIHLSGYYTEGLGSVAYLFDSFDAEGNKRDSYGGLAQVTYSAGRHKVGVNYGISYLDQTDFDEANVPDLFESNSKVTAGYYFSLTPNLTLTAEYSHGKSENHAGDDIDADSVNAGAFFAF